jgi:PAS domain S-box-containing protein
MWMGWGEDLTFFHNDAYAPTLGVKIGRALGASAREVWKEIWPDIGPRIDHVLENGEATWDEGLLLILERSGFPEETYHTFSYSPLSDDTGRNVGMLCVVTEETDRIIGERRVATLRDLASNIAGKNTRDELWSAVANATASNLKDMPFTLTYLLEEGGEARLVCSSGVAPGSPIAPAKMLLRSGVWPLEDALAHRTMLTVEGLDDHFADLPRGAWDIPPREALVVPIARSGEDMPAGFLIVGVNPYRVNDSAYRGFIGLVCGQIASGLANADAYEEERRRAEALAEIDRAKTAFFSNTSHEFRTPLTLMLSPLEDLLAGGNDTPTVPVERSQLELMQRNGLRLLKLVNTLLDFSRIEAGRVKSVFEPVDLAAYTAELASTFRSAMEKAGLDYRVECPRLLQPVYVDRDMWEKIVLNLISNAFKYTLSGRVTVSLTRAADGQSVTLRVSDTGVGIPEAELPRLFERFHRVADQRGRTQEGTGIGLALVQELVRLHRGTVEAQSDVGRGTTLSVTLPTGSTHLPADRVQSASSRTETNISADAFVEEALRWLPGAEPEPPHIPPATAERPLTSAVQTATVLLADDNADMRDYVRRLLADRYRVEIAHDGEEALAMARRRRPDLILSDIMMPRLDGFGLLRALRDDADLRDVPVILLSARAGQEASVEGLEAGADDYLVKPFSARELLARVRANLDMAALRREAVRIEGELRREAQESQERTESILSSISDGLFVVGPDWRFNYVNAAAERILDACAADMIGNSIWDFYPALKGSRAEEFYRRAMSERTSITFEHFYEPSQRWFDIRAYPARDGDLSIYFLDITERKAAEDGLRLLNDRLESEVAARTAELKRKEARLRTVFETSFIFQALLSRDGTLFDANATSLESIGLELEDVVGLSYWDTPWFVATPDVGETIRSDMPSVAAGRTVRHEIRLDLAVGGRRRFDFQMRPIRNELGEVIAIVAEAIELTARRLAEDALRHAQKMEAIGQLTGGVAHDFNNLLTIIRSSADLLRRKNVPEERRRRYVDAISDTADRAARLTSQLLAFSRRQSLKPEVFDAVDRVQSIADMLKTILGSRIAFEMTSEGHALRVEADRSQFETALINLVANARDAISGDGTLRVHIRSAGSLPSKPASTTGEGFVSIAVEDTGCGIAPEHLDKVFEPFFTTKDVGRGTGLGLSQVYGFALQSGGTVVVASEPGRGTTFTIYLPRTSKQIPVEAQSASSAATVPEMLGRVLVVEDNPEVGEFSCQLLQELDFDVVLAPNAEEALKILDGDGNRRFDLVFSDVVMPGMDGVTFGNEVRRRLPDLPVVLTSGYSHVLAEDGSHGFELLRKPYSVEELSQVLQRARRPRGQTA